MMPARSLETGSLQHYLPSMLSPAVTAPVQSRGLVNKMKIWKAMLGSQVHQESLRLLGQEQDDNEEKLRKCETFMWQTSIHPRRRDHRLLMSLDTSCFVRRNRRLRCFHQLLIVCDNTFTVPATRGMYGETPLMGCKKSPAQWWMDNGKWGAATTVDDKGSCTQQSAGADNLCLQEGKMSNQLFVC